MTNLEKRIVEVYIQSGAEGRLSVREFGRGGIYGNECGVFAGL